MCWQPHREPCSCQVCQIPKSHFSLSSLCSSTFIALPTTVAPICSSSSDRNEFLVFFLLSRNRPLLVLIDKGLLPCLPPHQMGIILQLFSLRTGEPGPGVHDQDKELKFPFSSFPMVLKEFVFWLPLGTVTHEDSENSAAVYCEKLPDV